ncbi:hypothetical protein KIN20_038194 [Parelaphostrongylus tenuis]|uniref:Uncharacterized protein n=1 Tax=Parelaphostrongylus tenuis TaxID=148309 RepID=A0AAD5WLL0_PARTN|nr:hypothetical protein KIN20_038194 [Parelaphostrongylus tenuis]
MVPSAQVLEMVTNLKFVERNTMWTIRIGVIDGWTKTGLFSLTSEWNRFKSKVMDEALALFLPQIA